MSSSTITVTPTEVRRLALEVQLLGAERSAATADAILELVRDLGSLQLDAAHPVAPSHRLVLFSRLGPFDPRIVDRLLWQDRSLFEYFAHAASIVPVSDFAIHRLLMEGWANGAAAWDRRVQAWVEANQPLRASILARLRVEGPLRTGDFELLPGPPWQSTAWPIARNVDRMLEFLWIQGRVVPAGHWRNQRVWELMERWLPAELERPAPPTEQTIRTAVERSLRSLGVATARHIDANFTRYRYPRLPQVLLALEAGGRIRRITVKSAIEPGWPGDWWIHADDLPGLDGVRAAGEAWTGRTALLSSLDNLIADRQRALRVFGLRFGHTPFGPRKLRGEATAVLPILHGDRFVGRVEARLDRAGGALVIAALRLEPNVPRTAALARVVLAAFEDLAPFLRADLRIEAAVPDRWRPTMRS